MNAQPRYRVWIVAIHRGKESSGKPHDVTGIAIEPADDRLFRRHEATAFLAGLNKALAQDQPSLVGIAVPVEIRFDDDLIAGQSLNAGQLDAAMTASQ